MGWHGGPETGASRGRWPGIRTAAAGVSHASTAPGSRPGDRTPRPTGSRRLSGRTCPAEHVVHAHYLLDELG